MNSTITCQNVFDGINTESDVYRLPDVETLRRFNFCLSAIKEDLQFSVEMFAKFLLLKNVVIHKGLLENAKREPRPNLPLLPHKNEEIHEVIRRRLDFENSASRDYSDIFS
jgi:hypothetical protein